MTPSREPASGADELLDAVGLWLERACAWLLLAAARTILQRQPTLDRPGALPVVLAHDYRRFGSDEHALSNYLTLLLMDPEVGACPSCHRRTFRGVTCYACSRGEIVRETLCSGPDFASGPDQRPRAISDEWDK